MRAAKGSSKSCRSISNVHSFLFACLLPLLYAAILASTRLRCIPKSPLFIVKRWSRCPGYEIKLSSIFRRTLFIKDSVELGVKTICYFMICIHLHKALPLLFLSIFYQRYIIAYCSRDREFVVAAFTTEFRNAPIRLC